MIKVCVGVAVGEFVRTQTVGTLVSLFKAHPTMGFILESSVLIHDNRNKIVEKALEGDYTHLFFVDSDMVFKPDVLDKFVAADKDIIGAMYNRRCGKLNETVVDTRYDNGLPNKPFRNFNAGTGCLLIKMDVFKRVPKPWFFFGTEQNPKGEDIYFTEKARGLGVEVWIYPGLDIKHTGEWNY